MLWKWNRVLFFSQFTFSASLTEKMDGIPFHLTASWVTPSPLPQLSSTLCVRSSAVTATQSTAQIWERD